jgi:hypothetical protein
VPRSILSADEAEPVDRKSSVDLSQFKLRQWGASPEEVKRAFEELDARGDPDKKSRYAYVQKIILGYREEPRLPPPIPQRNPDQDHAERVAIARKINAEIASRSAPRVTE